MRLFIGIDLPAPLRQELGRVQSLLRRADADVRWMPPANVHLTLAFLGEVGTAELAALEATLADIGRSHAPFVIGTHGVGAFPTAVRARVVWVGVKDPEAGLAALRTALLKRLARLGHAAERRPYRPHLTLGRVRESGRRADLRRCLGGAEVGDFRWRPRSLALFRSHLSPRGARYEILSRYPLAGSVGPA